jgi:aspartyl protease family protein
MPHLLLLIFFTFATHLSLAENTVFKCNSKERGMYYQPTPCNDIVDAVTSWSDRELTKTLSVMKQDSHYNSMSLKQGENGHYFIDGFVNNVPIKFLIDTGATSIVISKTIAQQAKLPCHRRHVVSTANGETTTCETFIAKLRIGSFNIENIEGDISTRDDEPLLGMSVLKQFKIEQIDGELRLTKH